MRSAYACNSRIFNETLSNEWTGGIIVKIPKKGYLRDCDNLRGICVLPAISKIIAKVILERIRNALISTVDAERAGFRAGLSCTDHIKSVRIIREQCKEFRSDLHMIFMDFFLVWEKIWPFEAQ